MTFPSYFFPLLPRLPTCFQYPKEEKNMASSASCSSSSAASYSIILLLCLLLVPPLGSLSSTTRSSIGTSTKTKPLLLPLRTQKIPSLSLPQPPNKLLFHHNVSLTISLSVGTPPQNVSMVLDTGSELSWLLCNPAPSSSPQSFHSRSSSSYSAIPCSSRTCQFQARDLPMPPSCDPSSRLCHVSLSYADASSSEGSLATDLFHLGKSLYPRTVFGCMGSAYSSSEGDTTAAGLLGMNRGALSFVTQLGIRKFSYCISDRDSTGLLLLSGAALLPLNYTPMIQMSLPLPYFDRVAYSVQLEGIRVGATLLPIPKSVLVPDHTGAGQTMVDSGTQFTFLLGPAYDALKAEFVKRTTNVLHVLNEPDFVFQGALDTCFRVPARMPLPRLPPVVLMFRGAEVSVVGERLLYRVAGEKRGKDDGVWCLTFGNSDLVPLAAYVIGHHHQQNVWVEYDLEKARVGFAPVRCDLAAQKLGAAL